MVAALMQTRKKKVLQELSSNPTSAFKRLYLLLSGTVILAFVVVHLQHFKLADPIDYTLETSGTEDPEPITVTVMSQQFAVQ